MTCPEVAIGVAAIVILLFLGVGVAIWIKHLKNL